MNYFKKFLAITLIFVMQFQSLHASIAVGGWGFSNPVVNGATTTWEAVKNGARTTVAISPSSAQVVKSLLRGGLVGLALSAVTEALLDGVDFVMDSAKQELRYKTNNPTAIYINTDPSPPRQFNSFFEMADDACFNMRNGKYTGNYQFVAGDMNYGAVIYPYCKLFNPNYDGDIQKAFISFKKRDEYEHMIPLTTLATQIINLAEQGNPKAKAYIASVVQDMLEHDEEYRKSLEAQLDAKLQEAQTNTPKNECDPPAGVKFNKVTHYNKHGRDPDPNAGSHGCMAKTGSPIHWHYDVNYQAPNGQCFLKKHNFGGCGVAPL